MRQHHTLEFKFQVVPEVLKEERTVNEIATVYQLYPSLITIWRSEYLERVAKAILPESDEYDRPKAELDKKSAIRKSDNLPRKRNWRGKLSQQIPIRVFDGAKQIG